MSERLKNSVRQLAGRVAVILLTAAAIGSCSSKEVGAGKLENYLSRLSNASELPIPPPENLRIARPPALPLPPRDVNVDTLSIIDFLALSGCELQTNIAKRNTTMGRSASPSQHLIFDLEFIRLAPECIDKLRQDGEGEIARLLELNLIHRRDQLAYTVAQGILGGNEWREFWRVPELLGDYPTRASGDVAQSLWELAERTKRFLNGSWSPEDEDLEPLLAHLRVDAGGQLLRAAILQEQALTQANQILTSASKAGTYCSRERPSEAGTIAKTVVAKYFAGDVQRWSSAVSQRHYEIQTPIAEIETTLDQALNGPYDAWIQSRDRQLNTLFSAPRHHVSVVQAAFNNC